MRRLWGVLVLLGGCDDTIFGEDPNATAGTTPVTPGYPGVLQIADAKCMPCHSAANHDVSGFGLDLETNFHANTVNVQSGYPGFILVVPSDPANSLLYLKLAGTQPSGTEGRMPLTGPLDDGSIALVEDWILSGAPAE